MGINEVLNLKVVDAIPNLANKAIKVKLSKGSGYARIRDKEAEDLIKASRGDEGQTVTKAVFKDKNCLIYRRAQAATEMDAYHRRNTLPHTDDGWRVLPNAMYLEYSAQMSAFASRLKSMEDAIVRGYAALVATDIAQRNAHLSSQGKPQAASVDDYPTADHMQKLLYVKYYFEPISTAGDFRHEVSPEDKARLDEVLVSIEAAAKADLYAQMIAPMQAFVARMATYKGEKGERLHPTIVTNISDLLTHLPKLSLSDDPILTAMLQEVKAVIAPLAANPSALKDDPHLRVSAKDKLAAIAARYKEYAA